MSIATHAERLQARLDKIKNDDKTATQHAMQVGEFIGGVAASSAYRAYLTKNSKPMPKILGLDADTAVGALMVVAGFLDVIPDFSDDVMNVGAGLVSGAIGNKVAGMVNPAIATKGEPLQMGAGSMDTSAHRGAHIMSLIRRDAALPVGRRT